DRKSTRLNSSHVSNSYAVFCLKKKRLPDNTFRLQITFTCEKKRIFQNKVVGADWNMFKNEVFRTSENKVIAIPKKVIEKVSKIEFKKDKITSLRDNEFYKHGKTDLWTRYHRKQALLIAKKTHLPPGSTLFPYTTLFR